MLNRVKFVQANGCAIMATADAVSIVRTLRPEEKEKHPQAKSAAYIVLHGGVAQHLLLRESFGFVLRKAGGNSADRIEVAGQDATKLSVPRIVIGSGLEVEENGQKLTVLNTAVQGTAGAVTINSTEPLADIFDMLSTEASDEQDDDEEQQAA